MRVRGRRRYWFGTAVVAALGVVAASATVASGMAGAADLTLARTVLEIDRYPARTKVTACADPLVDKPGVADFRALILSQVGGADDGLTVCKKIANSSGSYSDHADGRAWDWHVHAGRPADRAMVDQVLDWLLRTDERGNRNAMARRIGITYIIWNHQYYRVGDDDARWVTYSATGDPHDTHLHFSFSVAGATRQTSWWNDRGPLEWILPNKLDDPIVFGAGAVRPLAGDWDGDGRDAVGVYDAANRRFSMRDAATSGGPEVTTTPVGPFGAIPLAGDWDGTGDDEIGAYEPLARRFSFYSISGARARQPQVFGAAGDLPIVGDWDGNGVDDIGTYSPASRTFSLLLPGGYVRTQTFGIVSDTPLVGDWNGDGVDDIGAFRSSNRTFLRPAVPGHGGHTKKSVNYGATRHLPVIGDWDGDGTDDEAVVLAG